MMHSFELAAAVCLVAMAALVASEWRGLRAGVWVAKPLASTAFLWAACAAGAWESGYGQAVFLALFLSWWGDVLLIPRSEKIFRLGVLAFLCGHLAFAGAFLLRGQDAVWLLVAAVAIAGPLWLAARWLRPHVGEMRELVYAYMGIISLMVVLAAGTVGAHGGWAILLGAVCFYVSDLAVARDRFISSTWHNRLWGLPLYYGAQLILAFTVSL